MSDAAEYRDRNGQMDVKETAVGYLLDDRRLDKKDKGGYSTIWDKLCPLIGDFPWSL